MPLQAQFEVQMLDGGGDAAFFVAGRDHDGEQLERVPRRIGAGCFIPRSAPASRDGLRA